MCTARNQLTCAAVQWSTARQQYVHACNPPLWQALYRSACVCSSLRADQFPIGRCVEFSSSCTDASASAEHSLALWPRDPLARSAVRRSPLPDTSVARRSTPPAKGKMSTSNTHPRRPGCYARAQLPVLVLQLLAAACTGAGTDAATSCPVTIDSRAEANGVEAGVACTFPFTYAETVYTSCTSADSAGQPWCAVEGYETASSWGYCKTSTGPCSVPPAPPPATPAPPVGVGDGGGPGQGGHTRPSAGCSAGSGGCVC